uniref:Cytochrome P450 CYP3027C1 n=1 Tax=Tigriopus kingsejongensis TaxID=1133412 RepID=A0A2H4G2X3_9MAXI|nr:cytochrome P450 CYP3027C1 [Tigriopus kingsejongensis]
MDLTTILLATLVLVILALYWKLTQHRGYIETLGLPIDKPFGIFGSSPHALHKHKLHEVLLEKSQRLGKTYVRYEGSQPMLVTIDPDMIKSVMVKNFDSFTDLFAITDDDKRTTLDICRGDQWRALRKNLSPVFSSGKLKLMIEPMGRVTDQMVDYMDELLVDKKEVDVKRVFSALALEAISQCAFGIETDAFHNEDQELIRLGKEVLNGFTASSWFESLLYGVFAHFPEVLSVISIFPPAFDKMYDISAGIMKARRDQNVVKHDFLGKLLELIDEIKRNPEASKPLTDELLTAQGIVFFVAGYGTTANALSTLCYNLAKNPEIQERLYEELQDVIDKFDGRIDHESIQEMEYLEACIQENLRRNGPVADQVRLCTKDCEIAPGLLIKKGMRVDFPIYASHHTPEFFPDPDRFDPDRFLPANEKNIIAYTFRPFGGGPRQCIGQRFAMIQMKMAAAKMITNFRVVESPRTKLEYQNGDQFHMKYPELVVIMEKRNTDSR